ncbi:MAG: hypothetical protein CMI18_09850 [Opitutaceae bacterium]|nr:hypothetical protein [Opitutaceae bacterium]|tara:strand:+ start:494 stop:970 length:477 start_codon:yes stop_codon:yes gene_type:complete
MSTHADALMINQFLRISTAHTLREALGLLLYGEERKMNTGAIVVIDTEGEFAGLLTPEALLRGFSKPEEGVRNYESFLAGVDEQLLETVETVMEKDFPVLSPDTGLAEIIKRMSQGKHECLPVVENNRVSGLVYVTEVFKEAAGLALTPGEDGIQLDK